MIHFVRYQGPSWYTYYMTDKDCYIYDPLKPRGIHYDWRLTKMLNRCVIDSSYVKYPGWIYRLELAKRIFHIQEYKEHASSKLEYLFYGLKLALGDEANDVLAHICYLITHSVKFFFNMA